MQAADDQRSLGDLFGRLGDQLSSLVRQEIELARVELTSKVGEVGRNSVAIVAGGLIAYAGILVLLAAIVLGLSQLGLEPWLSALIVGGVVTVIGALLIRQGLAAMSRTDLAPRQTVQTVKDTIVAVKEQAK